MSLLFLRLAEYLQVHKLANCYLVDYEDGFMAKNLKETGVQLLIYTDLGKPVFIPDDAFVVFQSMTPWSIYPGLRLSLKAKIFFWNCYPFNLVPLLPGLRRQMQYSELIAKAILRSILRGYKNKIKKMISILSTKKAIAFMDEVNLEITQRYLAMTIADPVFLPVSIESSCIQVKNLNRSGNYKDCLRIVWVGRVVDFKYFPLIHALSELNRLQPFLGVSVHVTIVGSGNYRQQLGAEMQTFTKLQYEFIDYVAPINLDNFLAKNADMLIAMGTSALEGARLGIPTLLLDVSHKPVPAGYKFSWLHERERFNLGGVISRDKLEVGNDSLYLCLQEVLHNFSMISDSSLNYFSLNHELSKVARYFLRVLSDSNCTYSDFEKSGLLNRGFIYSIFVKLRGKVALS